MSERDSQLSVVQKSGELFMLMLVKEAFHCFPLNRPFESNTCMFLVAGDGWEEQFDLRQVKMIDDV